MDNTKRKDKRDKITVVFNEDDFIKHTIYNYSGKVIKSNKDFTIVDTGSGRRVGATGAFERITINYNEVEPDIEL